MSLAAALDPADGTGRLSPQRLDRRKNGCLRGLDNYFHSITTFSDKLIELNYHVTDEKDVCDFAHNSADKAMIYYDNLCITGTGGSVKVRINQNKVFQCEENATDELGIVFVFIFMCLILF